MNNTSRCFIVSVCSITLLVLHALSTSAAAQSPTLSFPELHLERNVTDSFGLSLSNDEVVEALQFRFSYDSTAGFEISGASLTSRTEGFEAPVFDVDAGDPGDVQVLIVLYSVQGAVIEPGDGDILRFRYTTSADAFGRSTLLFTETILADSEAEALESQSEDGVLSTYRGSMETGPATPDPVPEPSTLMLFGFGTLGFLLILRQKENHALQYHRCYNFQKRRYVRQSKHVE